MSVLKDPSHEAELRSSAEAVLRLSTDEELQRLLPHSCVREWGLSNLRQNLPLAHKHSRARPETTLQSDPSDCRALRTQLVAETLQSIVLDLGPPAESTEAEKFAKAATLLYVHLTGKPIWGTDGVLKPKDWVSREADAQHKLERRHAVTRPISSLDSPAASAQFPPPSRRVRKVRDLPRTILDLRSPLNAEQQTRLSAVVGTVRDFIRQNGYETDWHASRILGYLEFASHHLPGEPIWEIEGTKISPVVAGEYKVRNVLRYKGRTSADTEALVSLFHHVKGDASWPWGSDDFLKPQFWTEEDLN